MKRLSRAGYVPALLIIALLWLPAPLQAQDLLGTFEEKVTEFTLDNGLTFLIIERHAAPVVSYLAYADVGSVDEPIGQTGIAHMFEHMAFKGSTSIGTTNIEAEMQALRHQEEVYLQLRRERLKGEEANQDRIERLEEAFQEATEEAKALVESNEYNLLLERAGVTGLNASTSRDWTRYYYSLPANKLELIFLLESDRFLHPVLREFYTERDVVMEERRLRTESRPFGRLIEDFLATAFKAHPYGSPTIGHMSDLVNLTRTDAMEFYEAYYAPSNLVVALAGDVAPPRARELAQKYFGRIQAAPEPLPVVTEEPEQIGERRVIIIEQSQPFLMIGYHRPGGRHVTDAAYTVLADVLSRGRTSRFHTELVEEEKALRVTANSAFPGSKYPTLFAFIGIPTRAGSALDLEEEIYAVLEDIKTNGITQVELERAKTRARAGLIQRLDSNTGLANMLAAAEALTGDWRNVFRDLRRIESVTAEDVQEAAQETFRESNRTVGMIVTEGGAAPETAAVE